VPKLWRLWPSVGLFIGIYQYYCELEFFRPCVLELVELSEYSRTFQSRCECRLLGTGERAHGVMVLRML